MPTLLIAVLLLMLGSTVEEDVSAEQFKRLMDGLHADYRDVTLVFEGQHGRAADYAEGEKTAKFQGVYSIRSDGATLLDVFYRSSRNDKPPMRTTRVILDGTFEGLSQFPDLPAGLLLPVRKEAVPGQLNETGSVERILYLSYFRNLDDPARMGYQFLGWEDVDGHRCLHVQLYEVRAAALESIERKPIIRFWIDVERGGHPLKVEFWSGSELRIRVEKIRLGQVPLPDGTPVWLPVGGEVSTTLIESDNSKPPYQEGYVVVAGSVRLNQGLNNGYFRLATNRELPASGKLREYQRQFANPPPIRTDPVSVQEELDRRQAKADEQSKELVASTTGRGAGDWTPLIQVFLVALGVGLLGVVAYRKWRTG